MNFDEKFEQCRRGNGLPKGHDMSLPQRLWTIGVGAGSNPRAEGMARLYEKRIGL